MNPLGQLTGASSPQGTLNALDMKKVFRAFLVQGISLAVTLGIPYALGKTYVHNGTDYTPYVLLAGNALAEMGRRFLTAPPKV